MAEKPQKKRQRRMVKSLVKQRNERVSKTGRISSENGRPEIFAKNGKFPAKTGGLESMPIFLTDFRWGINSIQDNTFLKYLPAFPHSAYLYQGTNKNSFQFHFLLFISSLVASLWSLKNEIKLHYV